MKRTPIQVRVPIILDKQDCCPYEEPFGYIYKITNRINGHYYIGQHEFHHPWLDKTYKGSGYALWKAYEKYGIENFDTVILEWVNTGEKLNILEIYWIGIFEAYKFPFHYNLTEGGLGWSSEVSKDNWTDERKLNQSKWMSTERNPSYSEEANRKKSKSLKEYRKSHPELKETYSEQTKNLWKNEEFRRTISEKMTGENNPFYGKGYKQAGKLNHMYGRTGKLNSRSKAIVQLSLDGKFIQEFDAIADAERTLNFKVGSSCICDCCKGKQHTYKGYRWMYKKDYEKLV